METIIDKIVNKVATKGNRILAAKKIEVLRNDLFGVGHYKIQDLEFERRIVSPGSRYSFSYWLMHKNGKEYKVKYSYVLYLTFKRIGLIQ